MKQQASFLFFAGDTVVLKQSLCLGKAKKSIAPKSLAGTSERRFELLSCPEVVRKSRRPFAKFAISVLPTLKSLL